MSSQSSRSQDLGAFLLKHHKITGKHLAECLQTWNQHRTRGHVAPMHEVLVNRGLISMPGLQKLLTEQKVRLTGCPACGRARVGPAGETDFCAQCNCQYEALDIQTSMHSGLSDGGRVSVSPDAPEADVERPVEVDRYRLERTIGKGGMGEVVLAFDPVVQGHVAIKFLSLDLRGSQVPFKRFAREGRVLSNLQHAHLVTTLDVNLTSDPPYLVMEYVEGQSFEEYLSRPGYDIDRALEMLCQAIEGVSVVHEQGIVHRDLKPANILVDRQGNAKVTDFGLAKVMDSNSMLTRTGQSIGTPAYMAPEQIRGELDQLGPGTDIYSLGVILYRILSGRLPYEGLTMTEVLRRSLKEDIPAPESTTRFRITSAVSAVCQRATRNAVGDRYPDAQTFLDALRAALTGEAVAPPPPSSTPSPSPSPSPAAESAPQRARPSKSAKAQAQTKGGGCGSVLLIGILLGALRWLALLKPILPSLAG